MHAVHHSVFTPALAALLILGAAPVLAQTPEEPSSRAGLMEKAREMSAGEAVPPQRSSIDKSLYWYDNQYLLTKVLSGWTGIHLAGGDFPAGAGTKFGVGYDRALTSPNPDPTLPNRVDVNARAAYSTMGYARLSAGVNARNLGGVPLDVSGFSQYYEFPQEDFFGFGIDSLKADRTNYLLDATESGGSVRWRPFLLDLSAGGSYINPRIGHGTDKRFPSTEELFNPATVPGLGTQTNFVKAEASAAIDWRDNPAHPHAGGRYGVTAARFDDRDLNRFDFHRIDVNLQQYVPLTDRYRILALRAEGVFTEGNHGQDVPFYFQPTLGGAKELRGYREFRFRDQNSLLLGAEYRWEAWWALDGALFVDAGTVAARRQDLSLSAMDVSYGIGFRFHSNSAVVGRLDLAFSREGFVPLLRFEHVF
jgi:hypothetical protein